MSKLETKLMQKLDAITSPIELPNPIYPFVGHYFPRPAGRMHFLDEGAGEIIVMLHGNPTWSFYYRAIVIALRENYRCIVPDHIGCGMSDKPSTRDYDYSLQSRIDDVEALLHSLDLPEKITLAVHDWGGMIGLGYASRHPERIKRLIISNTAAFHLPSTKKLPRSLWLGRNTRFGSWLILSRNAFCRAALRWCATRKKLSPEVREMYLKPYDTPANRIAVLKFVQTIPLREGDPGFEIVSQAQASLARFANLPTLLLWGMRDFVFDRHFLVEWQRYLPAAESHTWSDCGHYLLEDAPEEVLPIVKAFLART